MSTSAPSQHPSTAATDAVESAEGMVRARPLTDADINALCRRTLDSAPDEVEVFVAERSLVHGLTLTPATLRLGAPSGRDRFATEHPYVGCVGEPIFPAIRESELSRRRAAQQAAAPDGLSERPPASKPDSPRSRRNDPNRQARTSRRDGFTYDLDAEPVGASVRVHVTTIFGTDREFQLFTSDEAWVAANTVHGLSERSRRAAQEIWVTDSYAAPHQLTPIFGTQVTASLVIGGLDPAEVEQRLQSAISREFGDAARLRTGKIRTRPVNDRRVNVMTYPDEEGMQRLLATNLLQAELSRFMGGDPVVTVEVHPQDQQVLVGD